MTGKTSAGLILAAFTILNMTANAQEDASQPPMSIGVQRVQAAPASTTQTIQIQARSPRTLAIPSPTARVSTPADATGDSTSQEMLQGLSPR